MKLLYCLECNHCFNLKSRFAKACYCGKSQGLYTDDINAQYSGPCIMIGFGNTSLVEAYREQKLHGDKEDGMGRMFDAFIIPDSAPSIKRTDDFVLSEYRKD